MRKLSSLVVIALITAVAIIAFQLIGVLVLYRYIRMDLYACLAGLFFLGLSFLIRKRPVKIALTPREREILQLVAEGKTNKEIAALQFVEVSTVKTHINNLYGKLSVRNRQEAREAFLQMAQNQRIL